ncbi:MAG: discoidin domain-containing protein [Planctomycetota bacterium]|jgi:hypothetical protein
MIGFHGVLQGIVLDCESTFFVIRCSKLVKTLVDNKAKIPQPVGRRLVIVIRKNLAKNTIDPKAFRSRDLVEVGVIYNSLRFELVAVSLANLAKPPVKRPIHQAYPQPRRGDLDSLQDWEWSSQYPFLDLKVSASSEQKESWPASNVFDGDLTEDRGTWLTHRGKNARKPTSAWLIVRLPEPRLIAAVHIHHQANSRKYRSIDYAIACRTKGGWKQVANVLNNAQSSWRAHRFVPIHTDQVRVTITKSTYGHRMGLNEVLLEYVSDAGDVSVIRSQTYHVGKVPDLGVLSFEADQPENLALHTRTAPDDDGKPGEWSQWSEPHNRSGLPVASPIGQWIQWEARFKASDGQVPFLRRVRIGSPLAIERVDIDAGIVPKPGDKIGLRVHFRGTMDAKLPLIGRLVFLNGKSQS